ncbi:MAG TPA: serine hydrolase [Mycobacterium sp.]|nr:serine hydrolase [Mycobacterium sp.]
MAVVIRLAVTLATAAALSVSGCGADEPAAPPPAVPTALFGQPPQQAVATPLPEDAVRHAVDKIDQLADDLMHASGIPGLAVAVVHGGKTVYAKGFGVRDVRAGDAQPNRVDADTVFQLASLSKPLGATVIAQQVGTGVIGWDTPLVSKLPWFELSKPDVTRMVTVGDMYSHRSGLPDHAGDQLEDLGYDRRYVLDHLRDMPLEPFRISYAYTNFGVTAAAEAVAAGAGKRWEDLADEVLYRPLGMTSTSSRFADYAARSDRAVGHIHVDGRYEPQYVRNADAQSPAGGVSASANDMARWMTMLLADGTFDGRQIVDPKALLPALTPQIVSRRGTEPGMRSGFYGYGFNVDTNAAGRTQITHSGAFELGAATNFLMIPSADVAIVALTNATPTGVPEALTAEFADLVQFGQVRQDWYKLYHDDAFAPMEQPVGSLAGTASPAKPAAAQPLSSYVGTYANPFWGPARVSESGRGLTLTLGPKLVVPLTHWDGNVFTFAMVTENSPPGSVSKATFDGNRLVLEYFDTDGKGTFTR